MCGVTLGHLRVIIIHSSVTIGNIRVMVSHLMVTISHPRVTIGQLNNRSPFYSSLYVYFLFFYSL